jgi:YHS domain-containing protein
MFFTERSVIALASSKAPHPEPNEENPMSKHPIVLAVVAALLAGTLGFTLAPDAAAPAAGGYHVNTSAGYTGAGAPLALHGYDPVAYFQLGKPVRGDAKFATTHDGAAYRFASEEHLHAFEATPARYVPQFGGYCAYGAAVGKKFDGDPLQWAIEDDRLYLNLNADIRALWVEDIPGNIRDAREHWTAIRDVAPNTL